MPVRSKKKIWPHARQDKAAGLIDFGERILAVAGLGYWPAKAFSATTAMRPSCIFVCARSYQTFTAQSLDKSVEHLVGQFGMQEWFKFLQNREQFSSV